MPHDIKGNALKPGDRVLIEAIVEEVQAGDEYCNVNLITALPMPPYTTGTSLVLNTRQVSKIEES